MLIAAYLVEAGLILVVAPWTMWWSQNFFGGEWPWIGALMDTAAVRAAVVILGGITVLAGLIDGYSAVASRLRRAEPPASIDH